MYPSNRIPEGLANSFSYRRVSIIPNGIYEMTRYDMKGLKICVYYLIDTLAWISFTLSVDGHNCKTRTVLKSSIHRPSQFKVDELDKTTAKYNKAKLRPVCE